MTEGEFERNCGRLWSEVEDAIAVFYTAEEIQDCARRDEHILDAIQHEALFWNVQVHALQTTLFITLGRIFDISGDAYSIHKLMRDVGQHFALLFSHQALRARKARVSIPRQSRGL
jgi:chromosomal replication initiation ATPase DnaA